jgi:L-2,4-diaminobutyrate decarboxylase
MGLLLARDAYSRRHFGHDTRRRGLHADFHRLKILCTRATHFSIEKAAQQLGLGTDGIVLVDTDHRHRMDCRALAAAMAGIRAMGGLPFAIVATAGTTDFGSIDDLTVVADLAEREGAWLHVDAAYGGALLMSPAQRHKLHGLGRANSVTIDFHKAFFQPISCGAFLVADRDHFELIRINADYLNEHGREADGFLDLVNWSIQTTRRFDGLKLWLSFQMIGADRFAAMIDALCGLAERMADRLEADRRFELLHRSDFSTLAFRWRSGGPPEEDDRLNGAIPRRLFHQGKAVLGHTRVAGRPCLKVTLINPNTHDADMASLLDQIAEAAEACGSESREMVSS